MKSSLRRVNVVGKTGYRFIFLVAVAIMAGLAACARVDDNSQTLIIGITGDTDSFHPLLTRSRFGNELSRLRFVNLMRERPDFISFDPELARSWDRLDGGKRIRFHLRMDVFWSDSVGVTAEDVAFSYRKQVDPGIGWSGASVKGSIKNVVVIDDSTIDFVFDHPYMYQLMDINDGVILPAHALKNLSAADFKKAFDRPLPESGAYRLKTWVPNQYIELARNPLYFRNRGPHFDRIIFKIIPDKTQLVNQLNTGEIQVVDGLPPHEAAGLSASNPNIKIEHFPFIQYVEVAWNLRRGVFDDVRVRQALTMAIDRQALVDHLLAGYGRVCNGPIHPLLWAYNPKLQEIPFDPPMARKLLREAGWVDSDGDGYVDRNGKRFEFDLLANIGSRLKQDAQVMIQEMLKKVGIKVNVRRLEWSVYVERLMARKYDAVLISLMSATKVDPTPAWHSSMIGPEGFNLSCYRNRRVDHLLEKARTLASKDEALPLWYQFQEIIVRDAPATFLWVPDRIVGLDKRIEGYKFSPVSAYYNLSEWYYHRE